MNRLRGACPVVSAAAAVLLAAAPAGAQAIADRYGATSAPVANPRGASEDAAHQAFASAPAAAPLRLRTRFLTWPGKVTPSAPFAAPQASVRQPLALQPYDQADGRAAGRRLWNPGPAVQVRPDAQPAAYGFGRSVRERGAPPQSIYDEPTRNPAPAYPTYPQVSPEAANGPARRQVNPASVYGPSAAQASPADASATQLAGRPVRTAYAAPPSGRASEGVRFYSLHRAFGLAPDPAPIPPQFFAATPDLSDPPGPSPRRLTGVSGAVAARAAQSANENANLGADPAAGADTSAQP